MVTGVSAWQGVPLSGTLDISIPGRYVDSTGNATVRHYSGVLRLDGTGGPRWVNALNTNEDLWLVVQGPTDPAGPLATFNEILSYGPQKDVRTTFNRRLISSDLNGLFFDYAQSSPVNPAGFGIEPLTMQAARDLLNDAPGVFDELGVVLADIRQGVADTEQYAGGIERRDTLAAIDASPDGLYRNMAETGGPVYRRSGGVTTPRPDLNGATSGQVQAAQATADTARTDLAQLAKTTDTVTNAAAFGLQGYPNDDTAPLRAALEYARTRGRRVYIPRAPQNDPNVEPHYLTDQLDLYEFLELYGDGRGVTVLKQRVTQVALLFADSGSATARIKGLRLHGMTLVGRADEYTAPPVAGNAQEHHHLLNINGVEDAEIDLAFVGPRGDAVYIGGGLGGNDERHNRNVRLLNPDIDGLNHCNRNGVSVIDCDGLLIDNPNIRRVTGNGMPGGIDIEPNHLWEIIQNIRVVGGRVNSGGDGVFGMSFKYPLGTYATVPNNIRVEGTKLDGTTPAGVNQPYGVHLLAFGDAPDIDQQISLDYTPSNVSRPFVVYGYHGVTLSGEVKNATNPALVGLLGSPALYKSRNIRIRHDFSNTGLAVGLLNAEGVEFTGALRDVGTGLLGLDGGSVIGLTIAPRSVQGAVSQVASVPAAVTQAWRNIYRRPADLPQALQQGVGIPAGPDLNPRSTLPLDTPASAKPNIYPPGMSLTTINVPGGAGWPAGEGNLFTIIDPTYEVNGIGFAWQMFMQRSTGRLWFRGTADGSSTADWGAFSRLGMVPQIAPEQVSGVVLPIGNAYSRPELEALEARVRSQGTAINGLVQALLASGTLLPRP